MRENPSANQPGALLAVRWRLPPYRLLVSPDGAHQLVTTGYCSSCRTWEALWRACAGAGMPAVGFGNQTSHRAVCLRQHMIRAGILPYVLLVSAGLVWGITFSFAKIAVGAGAHPIGLTLWQAVIGLFILGSYCRTRRIPLDLTGPGLSRASFHRPGGGPCSRRLSISILLPGCR